MQPIRNLDGVRGFAVLLVVFFHLLLVPFGWMGVQLFFVLSGYLITRILIESKQLSPAAYLKRFYVRRVLRIFPLYFSYLLTLGLVHALTGYPSHLGRYWGHLATFTYNWTRADATWQDSPGFTHMWSLSVEEQFYLLWPFIVLLLSPKGILRVVVATIALCPLVRYLFALYLGETGLPAYTIADATYWNTIGQMDAFASGAFVALMPAWLKQRLSPSWCLLVGLTTFLATGFVYQQFVVGVPTILNVAFAGFPFPLLQCHQHVWGYTIINVFFAAIVYWSVESKDHWLVSNRLITDVGRISYGMYVLHVCLMSLFLHVSAGRLRIDSPAGVLIYLALLYGVSKTVFLLLERPFLRLKNRFAA